MRNRRSPATASLLLGCVLLGMLAASPTCTGAVEREVRVGVILPLSGALAPTGLTLKEGIEFVLTEINGQGGIKSLGGAKIKAIFGDSKGLPEVGASEAERLILNGDVKVLMGCYQSSVTLTATTVSEKYKIPFIVVSSVVDLICERGFKYVFRPTCNTSMEAGAMMQSALEISQRSGDPIKTVAIVFENTDWGQAQSTYQAKFANKHGMKVVLREPYPAGAADLTPVVIKLKGANPDLVALSSYVSDAILLTKGFAELHFCPKAIVTGGGGFIDPSFIPAVGKRADGIMTTQNWASDLCDLQPPWAAKLRDAYVAFAKKELIGDAGCAIVSAYVLADALERARSTEPESIRKALVETNITQGPPLLLMSPKIAFDETGQNPYAVCMIAQIQNGKYVFVWPDQCVSPGTKPIYPLVPWDKR